MGEQELKQQVLSTLEEHFIIETEVQGFHFSGKKLRLDAIVRPKVTDGGKDPAVALGIEFKDSSVVI